MNLKDLLKKYESGNTKKNDDKQVPFFTLKKDGESATVRFLVKDVEDLGKYVFEAHKVKIGDYDNFVKCTGSDCVCCRETRTSLRMFVPVFNLKTNQVEIWGRGMTEIKAIMNLIDKYGKKFGDLYDCVFEIKRNGGKGDTNTSYSILFEDNDALENVESLIDEVPSLVGRNFRYILDLTPEQQADVLVSGQLTWTKKEEDKEEEKVF